MRYTLPANMVRNGDVVYRNDQRLEVIDSFQGSLYGQEHYGQWHLEFSDGTKREDYYGREVLAATDDAFFDWDELIDVHVYDEELHEVINPRTLLPYRWWVAVYDVDLEYGGPEEGGWWYDTGICLMNVACESYEQAQEVQEQLRQEYPDTGKRNSVLSGEDYNVVIEHRPGKNYPEYRPHYE